MRVTPRPMIGVLTFLAYLAVFYGVWIITKVDYNSVGDTTSTVLKWYVAPLAAGAVLLVIAVSAFGWWRPTMREVERATPGWLAIGPALMAVLALAAVLTGDYTGRSTSLLLLIALGSLLVGFCEEMATRGVPIVGFRARYTEPMVWFLSTLLFGLLHLPNWAFGAGPAAVAQVFIAFLGGSTLYLARRVFGTLLVPMALHALWDFSAFAPAEKALWSAGSPFIAGIVGLVLVLILLRRERGTQIPQAGMVAPVAALA
jgi:membrane protease YdiL (CAAX protease family)